MNDPIKTNTKKRFFYIISSIVLVLTAGVIFAWWLAKRTDQEMRFDILQQARLAAKLIDIEQVQLLSGTEKDLNSPEYITLKEQLAKIRHQNTACRFVYLMGQRDDGKIFFYADSEVPDSKDYSPPGKIYDEATACFYNVFTSNAGAVEGPLKDRWGTWVSALTPLRDSQTEGFAVVLGMDIDASAWNMEVLARTALPIGLMIIIIVIIITLFIINRRRSVSPEPVTSRLLPPLAGLLVFLVVVAGGLLWHQYQLYLTRQIKYDISDVATNFRLALKKQTDELIAEIQPITVNSKVKKALCDGNIDNLMADWSSVFSTLHNTQLYFMDRNRICLLRVHNPSDKGDLIKHSTVLEAELTGKMAAGIEVGRQGIFTLRVVQPVFDNGEVVGYVELGKEIGALLQSSHLRPDIQVAIVLHKENLDREKWEKGMQLLGRPADWNQLSSNVVTYASQGKLPDAFNFWANKSAKSSHEDDKYKISFDGKDWLVSAVPLPDAAGKEVGDLLIMRDVTEADAEFTRLLILGGSSAGIVLVMLLSFVYILLKRTDSGIIAQRTLLLESEQSYHNQFASNSVAMLLLDPSNGAIIDANSTAIKFYGYPNDSFLNMHITDITVEETEIQKCISLADLDENRRFQFQHRLADGSIRDVEMSLSSIQFKGRMILHCIIYDITERKKAEEKLRIYRAELETQNEELRRAQAELDAARVRYFALYDLAPVGYCTISENGFISEVNLTVANLLGACRNDLIMQHVHRFIQEDDLEIYSAYNKQLFETGRPQAFELRMIKADGTSFWALIDVNIAQNTDGTSMVRAVISDITSRKISEKYQEICREILNMLNEPIELYDSIQNVVDILKTRAEFDAVGIRLQKGNDFPYFAQSGFSDEFMKTENSLTRNAASGIGDQCELECTCGMVISGKVGAASSFFTVNGSFWTSDSTALANSASVKGTMICQRKRCIYQGYSSMALIPIRNKDRIIGLFHFSDRRKGRFTLDSVNRLEDIASHFGAALMRKQAEYNLKASESRYRILFDKMSEGLALHEIICDEKGVPVDYRFLDMNSAFEEITGLKKELIAGKTLLEILPAAEPFWINEYGEIALNGMPKNIERYSKELGKHFSVTAYSPQKGQFATLVVDITERKMMLMRLENKLKREKVFSSILSKLVKDVNYEDAIPYSLTAICKMLSVSHCGISIFGEGAENLYNWSTGNIFLKPDALIAINGDIAEKILQMNTVVIPVSITDISKPGNSLIIPMNVGTGKTGLLGFEKTDSEKWDEEDLRWLKTGASLLETVFILKESKQALAEKQLLLIQADKMVSLGILVAGVAHEINNPNNAIMLNVPIIQKIMDKAISALNEKERETGDFNISGIPYSELKGEIPFLFASVTESANRIKAIVDGLKEYARENSPKAREKLKVSRVVESCLSLLANMTKHAVENISVEYQDKLPLVNGNFQQIEQVLINLVQNACESTPDRKIKLKIETTYDSIQRKLMIKVIDNGKGIPEKNLKLLTDPFFTTKRNSGGTGLGLSISASIIKEHGGELSFQSEEGKGTAAIIILPVETNEADTEKTGASCL